MISIGATDIGRQRATNQDAFVCGKLDDQAAYAIVCDGMGGANGGNIASSMAIRTLMKRTVEGYRKGMTVASVQNVLESAIAVANINVYDEAGMNRELHGMGTTLVMAVALENTVLVAHIGDSRAYVITKEGVIEQITTDHSVVQQMVDKGQITPEEAKTHPRRNFITRALGVADVVACDFAEFELPSEAVLLLCTDGLSGMVEADRIAEIVTQYPMAEVPDRLIAAANLAGGSDNITVALMTQANQTNEEGVVGCG